MQLFTEKHFKIWFSNNPKSFLPLEHQARLLEHLKENPHHVITLITSLTHLNEDTIKNFKAWAQEHNIYIKDINEIEVTNETERALIELVKQELQQWVDPGLGSSGPASDLCRVLSSLYRDYGIYSDMKHYFKAMPSFLDLKSDYIISTHNRALMGAGSPYFKSDNVPYRLGINNDILYFAENCSLLKELQEGIVENYIEFSKGFENIFKARAEKRALFKKSYPLWLEKHVLELSGPIHFETVIASQVYRMPRQSLRLMEINLSQGWEGKYALTFLNGIEQYIVRSPSLKTWLPANNINFERKKNRSIFADKSSLFAPARPLLESPSPPVGLTT